VSNTIAQPGGGPQVSFGARQEHRFCGAAWGWAVGRGPVPRPPGARHGCAPYIRQPALWSRRAAIGAIPCRGRRATGQKRCSCPSPARPGRRQAVPAMGGTPHGLGREENGGDRSDESDESNNSERQTSASPPAPLPRRRRRVLGEGRTAATRGTRARRTTRTRKATKGTTKANSSERGETTENDRERQLATARNSNSRLGLGRG